MHERDMSVTCKGGEEQRLERRDLLFSASKRQRWIRRRLGARTSELAETSLERSRWLGSDFRERLAATLNVRGGRKWALKCQLGFDQRDVRLLIVRIAKQ